ncbi:hypothetical protein ACO3VM_02835 [Methanocaldococcus sp. 10A]
MEYVEIRATKFKTFQQAIQERLKDGYKLIEDVGIWKDGRWEYVAKLKPGTISL